MDVCVSKNSIKINEQNQDSWYAYYIRPNTQTEKKSWVLIILGMNVNFIVYSNFNYKTIELWQCFELHQVRIHDALYQSKNHMFGRSTLNFLFQALLIQTTCPTLVCRRSCSQSSFEHNIILLLDFNTWAMYILSLECSNDSHFTFLLYSNLSKS